MVTEPLKVRRDETDMRLDKFIQSRFTHVSFVMVQKMCRKGQIRVNGKRVKANDRLSSGQEVRVPPSFFLDDQKAENLSKNSQLQPLSKEDRRLIENNLIYEDKKVIAYNKPYNLPVQAGSGHHRSLDRLMVRYFENKCEPRLVHRLDKTTTGCVLFAKSRKDAALLSESFKKRSMQKTYWAIVRGKLKEKEGRIVTYLDKESDENGFERMHGSHHKGQRAETEFRHIASAGQYHWLEVYPKTGRTHQIRVHLSEMGTPIVGDVKYGGKRLTTEHENVPASRVYLHARKLDISIDNWGNYSFEAPLPDHFKKVFSLLAWDISSAEETL